MTDRATPITDRRLVLRADASAEGGTGHMMRVLALTEAWLDAGGRARWLVAEAPGPLLDRIAGEGVEIDRMGVPATTSGDAAFVRAALARDPSAMAVIDGLGFGSAYLAALGDLGRRALLIDDMADQPTYPVGLLLNQNAHADRAEYPADATCRFLLGTRYVLLRREFVPAPPPRTTPGRARRLLVTFGGSDPTGMTARTIEALRLLPGTMQRDLEVRVIVGAANPDADRLSTLDVSRHGGPHLVVERSVDDMPSRMAWADLAITSGGSTVWELARTGCPALVVETVPVERRLVSGLARLGLFGHVGPGSTLDPRDLADEIAAKAEDGAWRAAMSALGMDLIDGGGAGRVVDAMAEASSRAEAGDREERT
jgi:UDP-2,4-diacetamido-2,4,6-trideoxy-beta-L-altropyranose hydrolase